MPRHTSDLAPLVYCARVNCFSEMHRRAFGGSFLPIPRTPSLDQADPVLADERVGILAPGAEREVRLEIKLPPGNQCPRPTGDAFVDADNDVPEANEATILRSPTHLGAVTP